MVLSFYNHVTGLVVEVDSTRLTHQLARQLVPQDRASQAAYDAAERAGETPNGAMSRVNAGRERR